MAQFKTLAEAYEWADALFLEPHHLDSWSFGELKELLNAFGFTKAQKTVALANVYETTADDDATKTLCVLHQMDDGFQWAYVGYYDCINDEDNISEA